MQKLIGVTTSILGDTPARQRRAARLHFYLDAVRAAGGAPVVITDGAGDAPALARGLDGLLLTGGDDISPALYGEANIDSREVDDERDALEIACLRAFADAGKPVLGICRGMQLMAVALGGTLWQDIPAQTGAAHPFDVNHEILVRGGTFLASILPELIEVNSTHHQAVRTLPPRFMATAMAADGVIEAMQPTDGRSLWGVQSHPERLIQDNERFVQIFRLLSL